jgi:hypothetical protein
MVCNGNCCRPLAGHMLAIGRVDTGSLRARQDTATTSNCYWVGQREVRAALPSSIEMLTLNRQQALVVARMKRHGSWMLCKLLRLLSQYNY